MKKYLGIFIFAALLPMLHIGCIHAEKKSFDKDEQVILLHGFSRSSVAMWQMSESLEKAGYDVHLVSYSSFTQDMNGIRSEVSEQIDAILKNHKKPTHFVGHSLGGLLIRSYLDKKQVRNLGKVVMLGSPNKGTPVVDYLREKWWFPVAGPAAISLSSQGSKFLSRLKPPKYSLGVIAGLVEDSENDDVIPGKDDGLVQVESTKVQGMKDFKVVKSGHSSLRNNLIVHNETIHFLKFGKFRN